ncbi:MAG: polysaccharide biosynthesis tyrosine autokinase [Bacteroidales bacterium]|nr:polysaccharide biosynthesis tyrosine autokinase [Bacteroidales bacterium]
MENYNAENNESEIQIKDILRICLRKWYWFAISVAVCLSVALIYILKTHPSYYRSAELIIKSKMEGNSISNEWDSFADYGLFKTATTVNDEIAAMGAKSNISEVVRRLGLDQDYYREARFHDRLLYGKNLPARVSFLDLDYAHSASLRLRLKKDGALLSDFDALGLERESRRAEVSGAFGDTLSTPLGRIIVIPTAGFRLDDDDDYPAIRVYKSTLHGATLRYSTKISVGKMDKESNVILLSITDQSVERAENVLNTLVAVYNEKWIHDNNQLAVSTSRFIDERLAVIEKELSEVDSDISNYKSSNLLTDVRAASQLYLQRSDALNAQALELNNYLYMARYLRSYLQTMEDDQLIPSNSGIGSLNVEDQIRQYNTRLLERNNLAASTSTLNPLVREADSALKDMRSAVLTSLDNQIMSLEVQIKSLERTEQQTSSKIAANPTQAKYLLSVERQQTVKEQLYLFLLKKREENELSQAFTAYNTRIIDPPGGIFAPVAPAKMKILAIAFLIGLILPLGLIYLLEALNTTVRSKRDLKDLSIPFLGQIPYTGEKRQIWQRVIRFSVDEDENAIVVKPDARDIVNEAFRVFRTNLEFVTSKEGNNVIAITSYNPGSGKSFISLNLAIALSIKKRKVLLVDGDLRHASISSRRKAPSKGLSGYLSGKYDTLKDLIFAPQEYPGLEVLPVGAIPPNPTELIADPRFAKAIETLRKDYDFILIDCPPVDILADAQIIEKAADRTVFVVRAGLLEKSMLPELEKTYKEGKYKNMSLVLNSTYGNDGHYGYRYGYHYGYRYGYAHNYYYGKKTKA